jgi:hypothetical protein
VKWVRDTLQPFGENDATLQITVFEDDRVMGLFTWRGGKDTDLTAAQFRAVGEACLMAARRLRGEEQDGQFHPET